MIPGYQLSVISAHISGGVCHLCISGCKSSWVLILIRIIQTSRSYSARLKTKLINSCRILLKLSWAVFKVSARWNLLRLSDLWCSTGPLQLYGALSCDEKRYPPIPVNRNWPLKTFPSDYAPLVPLLICVSHIFYPFKPVRSDLCVYCCLWDKCKLIFGACAVTTDTSSRWNVNTVWKGPLPGLTLFLLWDTS